MKHFLICALLLCVSKQAGAWGDRGHMTVAQIAYNRLTPTARARADALVPIGADARNDTFVSAACWADDLKDDGVRLYDDWHYYSPPFFDGVPARDVRTDGRLLWALEQCVALLKPRFDRDNKPLPPAPDEEKARALRFILHLVGDIHQPLHAASRYSPETPQGDVGGNRFLLDGKNNLHWLWDSGPNLFPGNFDRDNPTGAERAAREMERRYPPDATPEWKTTDFATWHRESFELAQTVVYKTPFGQKPSERYLAQVGDISARRVVVAGYRLADLLNGIFVN